ncbi:hypothetical protein RMSM_06140 [Rhodopirellula maiorica SM1]|uniref:BNR repeat-containing family member n=2 Tax=Novipirellula TaxID=2795426 RepID=M5RSJ7_9BACT|nr:hypothetical protein RMSM_06140 [Rhodopirellula maiorica SM1]
MHLIAAGWIVASVQATDLTMIQKTTVDPHALTFADGPATRFGNNVNGRTHQQQALISHRGYQYTTYVDANRRVCLGRRKLSSRNWSVVRFEDHRFLTNDSHNTAVIGICENDGTIHLAFDHHATPLNYRVSKLGVASDPAAHEWDASLFGPIMHSLGRIETADRVTYPRFISSPDGNLMFYYRGVTSGNGDGMLEKYDGNIHSWVQGMGKFIARDIGVYQFSGRSSLYRCPYMNPLTFAGKRLHVSWVWRDRFARTHPSNQHDLCYAYSDDFGVTWHNSDGIVIGKTETNPIHLNSAGLVVIPIPPDAFVSNSNAQHVFANGQVHIVMRQRDAATQTHRYHHYWCTENGKWTRQALPFSGNRPKLVGTDAGQLILIYSDEIQNQDRLLFARGVPSESGDSYEWQQLQTPVQTVLGSPLVDVQRWADEQVLSIYCQAAPPEIIQTKATQPIDGIPSALHVIDYRLP